MKKEYVGWRIIGRVIIACCVLFISGCGGFLVPLPYRSLAPFEGKVVDLETKAPIEGAVVLAVYYFEMAGIVAGSNHYVGDGQETLTNKNGEFKLPRTRRWFVLQRGYPEGMLVIFKPGYGLFPDHIRSEAVGVNKGWPPPGEYIMCELPKLNTIEERKNNVQFADRYSDIPYKYKNQYWEKVNEECVNVGIPINTMTEEERGE